MTSAVLGPRPAVWVALVAACSSPPTDTTAPCTVVTSTTVEVNHARLACPYEVEAITAGSGGKGTAYAFVDGGEARRALIWVDPVAHGTIDVAFAKKSAAPISRSSPSMVTDDEGSVHMCTFPSRTLSEGGVDHSQYVDGSWRTDAMRMTQLSCRFFSGGPAQFTLYGLKLSSKGVFLARRDERGVVTEFVVPTYASSPYEFATAILDTQEVPRVAGFKHAREGATLVVRSALPGEPEVEALRYTRASRARAARVPGTEWPAFVVEPSSGVLEPTYGYHVAYPTPAGYRDIAVPGTETVDVRRCGCDRPSPCRDEGVRPWAPALAWASGALWLAWIHQQADRDVEYSGKGCGEVSVLADRSQTEVVIARITEEGVGISRRIAVANPPYYAWPKLDARAMDEHLVIGVVTVPTEPELLVVDTSKL